MSLDAQYAGVDLGSNSFHMVLGQVTDSGRVRFVDRHKEYVRLAGGLKADNKLDKATVERALACLSRFGERLGELPASNVRVVGTNTLRKARNAASFVDKAQKVLGHRIDIISGLEEARLVWRGALASLDGRPRRLVVDIGGGSTELILGTDAPDRLDSLFMGCVSWTHTFFGEGKLSHRRFKRAELAARRELAPISRLYRDQAVEVIGSSGTARALEKVLAETGISREGITLDGLDRLKELLVQAKHIDHIELPAISRDRALVLPGGLAVMRSVLRSLHLPRVRSVDTALREGILLELVGREEDGDIRDRTVQLIQERFGADAGHAQRIEHTATMLFDQVAVEWDLDPEQRLWLRWACRLHEVGLFLRYSGYHRHSAYLIRNGDLPGFSRREQSAVAALVEAHRGRLDELRVTNLQESGVGVELALLLRLAVRLQRSRSPRPRPTVGASADAGSIELRFPEDWLAQRPLTIADLDEEKAVFNAIGMALDFC